MQRFNLLILFVFIFQLVYSTSLLSQSIVRDKGRGCAAVVLSLGACLTNAWCQDWSNIMSAQGQGEANYGLYGGVLGTNGKLLIGALSIITAPL